MCAREEQNYREQKERNICERVCVCVYVNVSHKLESPSAAEVAATAPAAEWSRALVLITIHWSMSMSGEAIAFLRSVFN